jgi:non-specific serine/threonine protein kinase
VELYRSAGDTVGELPLAGDLGLVAYHEQDYEAATVILEQSLDAYRRHGMKDRVAGTLTTLGDLAQLSGDNARAGELYQQSLALWRELHGVPGIASAEHKLGRLSRIAGDTEAARHGLTESLALQQELGNKQGIVECLALLAGLAADAGQLIRATRLFSAVTTLMTAIGLPLAPIDRLGLAGDIAATRTALGAEDWERGWAAGTSLSISDAIDLALLDNADDHTEQPERSAERGALSAREREVCALLARGLSNKQISATLTISEKTVGSHIDHIMTKLGVRSRTRIALWAAEQGFTR